MVHTKRKQHALNANSRMYFSKARKPVDSFLWKSIDSNYEKSSRITVSSAAALADRTTKVSGLRANVDSTTFGTVAAATDTLTRAESGTLFIIDGTADNVVNMPALSTDNVGVYYEFFLSVACGAGTTTTFVLPGAVSHFYGHLDLLDGVAANTKSDYVGDTLTLVNSTVKGARVKLQCVIDTGAASTWIATVASTPIATIA